MSNKLLPYHIHKNDNKYWLAYDISYGNNSIT